MKIKKFVKFFKKVGKFGIVRALIISIGQKNLFQFERGKRNI